MTIKSRMDRMADALDALNLDYSQARRWSFIERAAFLAAVKDQDLDAMIDALVAGKAADCSSSDGAIGAAGCPGVDLTGTFYTGNFNTKMKAAGFDVLAYKGLSGVRHGDFLNSPGHHVVYKRGKGKRGKFWSAESTVGYRTYSYPSVWDGRKTYIVRPVGTPMWQARVLAAHANGTSEKFALSILALRLPWDGLKWAAFMAAWAGLDQGMTFACTADAIADVPDSGHAFVVLGSALNADGTIPPKYKRRLQLALAGLDRFAGSRVLISGGKSHNGVTEAAAGRDWLIAAGVDPERILVEEKSSSTVGNALYSVPELRAAGITTYTLVSDTSHLRRAQVEFLASQLKLETAENVGIELTNLTPLAFNDYQPNAVKTELPVTAATRKAIAAEVAMVLGLSDKYAKAI